MKAVILKSPRVVDCEEMPIPKIGSGDVLIKVKASGVCGTDIEKIDGLYTASKQIIGHEVSGIILDVGEDVINYKIGDTVFPQHHVPCYNCNYCNFTMFTHTIFSMPCFGNQSYLVTKFHINLQYKILPNNPK